MSTIRTRTFCCCIPVRAGAILLSLLGVLGGALIAAAGIITLTRHGENGSKTSLIIQVVVYGLLALLSLFGLIGAIGKKLAMVRLYFGILMFHLFFSIGCGIFAIYYTFKNSPSYVSDCIKTAANPTDIKACNDGAALMKGLMVGIFIVAWLLEIWACAIVHGYSSQLSEEIQNRSVVKDTEAW